MQTNPDYQSMNFGCKKHGQSIVFKIKYSTVEDELFKAIKQFTYWQDSYVTEGTKLEYGKPVPTSYFIIVGSFHISNKKRFKALCDFYIDKRDYEIAYNKYKKSQEALEMLELNQEYERYLSYQDDYVESQFDWGDYLTPPELKRRKLQQDLDNLYSLDSL